MYYKRSQYDYYLYPLVSGVSYAIRYAMCYFTIEKIPIFESETAQWIWSALFGGVIYSVFWCICYPFVGRIADKFGVVNSSMNSLIYLALYIPLALITYSILIMLTKLGVLPISKEITFNLLEFFAEKFSDLITFCFKKVTDIALGISKAYIL